VAIDEGEGGADVVARYRTPPEGVRALGIAVTGAGRILGQRRLQTERVLNCYAGVLVLRGAGFLELQGRGRHEVRPGSFFWLPPGISHRYGPTPDGWDEYWVLFDGPAAAAYRDLGHLGAEHPVARHHAFVPAVREHSAPQEAGTMPSSSTTSHCAPATAPASRSSARSRVRPAPLGARTASTGRSHPPSGNASPNAQNRCPARVLVR
jgi:hypothetical protein